MGEVAAVEVAVEVVEAGRIVLEMNLQTKTIEIKGKKYQYLDTETGNPAVVFIHGLGSNKDVMPKIFENFIDGYRCIFLDLPAHNKIPAYDFNDLTDFSEYIINFIHGTHLTNFSLVGFSFGGVVAIQTQKDLAKEGIKCKAVAWASPIRKDFLTLRSKAFFTIVDAIKKKDYRKLPESGWFKLVVALLGIKVKNSELESFKYFENELLDKFYNLIPSRFINTENQNLIYIFGTKDPLISEQAFKKTKLQGDYQNKYLINKGGHYYTKEGRQEATKIILDFLKLS